MPPNRDNVTATGASSGNRGVEAPTFVAEDFCLIDDPPEYEDQLGELDGGDKAEQPAAASTFPIGGRVSDVSNRAGRLAADSVQKVPVRHLHKPVTSTVANVENTLLATDVAVRLDRWTRSVFASGKASPYDKAMDLAYNTLKQHGGDPSHLRRKS